MAMTGVAIPDREINGRKIKVETEDNAQVLLDFGKSTFAVVTSGFTMQQYRTPALEVYGTAGTIQMLGDDWDPDGYEMLKAQQSGREGRALSIESTFTPPVFAEEVPKEAAHLVHDRSREHK
jgi:predicted dehydrogenase